jgi:diadenosine tetraphosphate (Ap4A) HIT family hydrolase
MAPAVLHCTSRNALDIHMIFTPSWELHPQLARDTILLGDLALSQVLVIKDANYPWLLLVPRRPDIVEIIDLDRVEQAQLMVEIDLVGRALKSATACDKLNVAALGNAVSQLHVHLIARRKTDKAWPKPVWGVAPPLDHDPAELKFFMDTMRSRLWVS